MPQPSWSATGSLLTGHQNHTATLLANGKVLVTGGGYSSSGFLSDAEIYSPALLSANPISGVVGQTVTVTGVFANLNCLKMIGMPLFEFNIVDTDHGKHV